jgi:outer membrane receptor protein involved in Fe transport
MAFWLEEDLVFGPRFKAQLGLRGDYFTFDVIDHLDDPGFPGNGLPHASGYDQSAIISPNLNLVFSPMQHLDIYVNGGTGFHSNDARDVILAAKIREIYHAREQQGVSEDQIEQELIDRNFDPGQADIETLPRAIGGELGTRLALGNRALISLAGWYLHMAEELVFVGDEGSTEISGETRRLGIDLELRLQFTQWLWADADFNFADGRYVNEPDDANYVPLAPRITSQGGVNLIHPNGFEGSVRYRYLADRPANEDNTVIAIGHFLGNVVLGYRFRGIRVFVQFENIFNTDWNEAQFDTESRLFNEATSVSELHFTPGNPFNVQAGISYEF